ncbi:MAG: ligase-associated DNA damage response endonuclease PdeM [Chloroflexota bacterium]|nr:ligase-associated DNA damage response endonuclease PdeM [Chloroflexota bacterium]
MTTITIVDETLTLLPDAALYWARTHTLFIADVHLGKTDSFRRAALAVPSGTTLKDLARLTRLITTYDVRRVIVLGDLLHAYGSLSQSALAAFGTWRAAHVDLELVLIRGNHDRATGDPPKSWGFDVHHPGIVIAPFVLHHEPPRSVPTAGYALCGHLHPGAHLIGQGRQQMVLPCFWFQPKVGVLPAFGSFTGTGGIRPTEGDAVYVIADGIIMSFA